MFLAVKYELFSYSSSRPHPIAGQLLQLATSDILLFYAVFILAGHPYTQATLNSAEITPVLACLTVEVIHVINQRCSNPEVAATDGTIGAIAIMALCEV